VAGSTRGERSAFIAHIIGGRSIQPCLYASDAAKAEAVDQRAALAQNSAQIDATATLGSKKRSHSSAAIELSSQPSKKLKQGLLKTFRGVDMPFSQEETAAIQAQVLRATVSANLPFQAMRNPEMLKLFGMLRTVAPSIIPSRQVIGGRLLDEASSKVDLMLVKVLSGRNLGLS
jgi:hypothetical protein